MTRHRFDTAKRPIGRIAGHWRAGAPYCLLVGCLYLLVPAFGHQIWYDESYSVVLTSHGWSGIWDLGSSDVHPVGYYMLLNLVRLVFGEHIVAYRLLSAAAACALVVAGYVMLSKDAGPFAARLFSALACLAPPLMHMAFQIRMYSWATLTVCLCFLYAMRICIALRSQHPVRASVWMLFSVFSLASAYLHYYAVLAVAIINLIVLVTAIRRARDNGARSLRPLAMALISAVIQLAAYLPWIYSMLNQVHSVSSGYWIQFQFPQTLLQLIAYPVFGEGATVYATAIGLIAGLLVGVICALRYARLQSSRSSRCAQAAEQPVAASSGGASGGAPVQTGGTRADFHGFEGTARRFMMVCGLVVYVGVLLLACVASLIIRQSIIVNRYMVVALGPLLVSTALGAAITWHRRMRMRPALVALCAGLAVFSFANMCENAWINYSSSNDAPMDYIAQVLRETSRSDQATGDQPEHHGITVVSDSPYALGVLAAQASRTQSASLRYADWTKDAWWDQRALPAYLDRVRLCADWNAALDHAGRRLMVIHSVHHSTGESDSDVMHDAEDSLNGIAQGMPRGWRMRDRRVFIRPYDNMAWIVWLYETS
ncbi:hypothetical protein [Bifidobacterium jacchi]|uniref:hypothetical protein n=1 Tax=Bifidobacterium jacchi TaxID=2490545 RepID=UPI001F4F70D6|nr:hypothetical protein [Bifidobacterium jacchi]